MSGLLDKATKSANADKKNKDAPVEDKSVPFEDKTVDSGIELDKRIKIGMQVAGVITLLVSMFLAVLKGVLYVTLFDIIIIVTVMIFGLILFNGADVLSKSISMTKVGFSAGAFSGLLIMTFIGTMFIGASGGVTIASMDLDGDNDEIDLEFFGPRGMDYTVEVLVNDTVVYSHDDSLNNYDKGKYSISLDKFWAGNSMDMNDNSEVTYEIRVDSEGGTDSVKFDSIMNREVDTGFVSVTEITGVDSNENKEYIGIEVQMIIGMGNPDASFGYSNQYFTGIAPKPIASDWSATLTVKYGNSIAYQYATINANEGVAPPSTQGESSKEFSSDWVKLKGTEANNNGISYLARGDFYSGDGCYTFEIEIINDLGEEYTDSSSMIEVFWESNEATPSSDDDQTAEACPVQ